MATAGTLNLVLGADSTKLRQELGKVRQESQSTALAITSLFSGDTINAVGFRLVRGTVVGLINDIDDLNNGLSITDSLVNNLGHSFSEMGDIALLQLGQIAEFLGDDLFQSPLAGIQSAALEDVGLGQLEGAFKIITAGSNAVTVLQAGLNGLSSGFAILDGVLNTVQGEAQAVADFFLDIARSAEMVSDILKTVATVIDGAIDLALDSLEAVFPAFGMVREGAKMLGLEFSVGKSILGDYIDQLDRIEGAAAGAAEGVLNVSSAAGQARSGISKADAAIDELGGNLKAQKQAAQGFESAMKDLADAAVLFDKWREISDIVDGALGSFEQNFNAALNFENLGNRLELVSNAAGGAKEDLEFLRKTTDDLGVDFNTAAEGFTQFSTAATLANLTTDQTKDIFESVTQATSVMGLSAADAQGTFLALQQILSSGNLQLEELNQISERVPGTFQAAAAALGVTTAQLKDLVSTGKVDSKQFLLGFADQLKNFTDAGVVDAMDGGTAAINRFNNSLNQFQVAAGSAWVDIGTPALNMFSNALEFAAKNEEAFSSAIDAVLIASIPFFLAGLAQATVAIYQFIVANKTASVSLLGKQLKFSAAELGKYAATVALAYGALMVFYRVMDRVKDGAQTTRDAIKSVDRSILELNENAENTPSLEKLIPEDPPPTDWLDGIVQAWNDLGNNPIDNALGTGDIFDITTNGEKQLTDLLTAIEDFGGRANTILSAALTIKNQTDMGTGPIKDIERIDAALKGLQQRKLGIDPKDEKAVAAIAAEEEQLLKQRADAQDRVLKTQSAVNNALTQAKQELQNLDPTKLGSKGYEEAKQKLEAMIKTLETGKTEFDKIVPKAQNAAQSITDAFKKSNEKIQQDYADRQACISEAVAAGTMTEEEARKQNSANEKEYLEAKLRNNKETLDKLKSQLENDAKLRAIDPSAAGLLTQDQLKEYKAQVTQIESDTAQARIQLAQNVTDFKKDSLDQELKDLEDANAEAEAVLQRSQNNRIADIRQRQLAGKLTEEQAQAEINQIQQDGINEQLDNEYNKLDRITQLEESGVLTTKQAAEKKRDILSAISDLNLQRLEGDIEAQKAAEEAKKKASEEALKAVEQANARAEAVIENSQTARITAIREQQRDGVLSEEQAQAQIQAIQNESSAQTITQKQNELAEIQRLRDEGKISAEDAAKKEEELIKEIGDLNLQRIEQEIQSQQELKQARLDALEAETERAQRSSEDDQTAKITAIKAAQRDRIITEQQADAQIAAIEQAGTRRAIELKQNEILGIRRLQAEGVLTAEEAADREAELTSELGDLKQEEIENQIDAQQNASDLAIEAIEKEGELRRQALETASEQIDLAKNAAQAELDLLSAKMQLQESLNSLEEERLNTRIAAAEAAGDEVKADRLRKDLIREQRDNLESSFKAQKQQLDLQQKIKSLDALKEITSARIAQIEAEIALRKAYAEGATKEEIDGLKEILGLRQSQVKAAVESSGDQKQINQIEQQNLRVDQGISLEQQKQKEIEAGLTPGRGAGRMPAAPSFSDISTAVPTIFTPATIPVYTPTALPAMAASFPIAPMPALTGAVPASSPLMSSGLGAAAGAVADQSSIARVISAGSELIVGRLDKLEVAILQLANSPRNLTVQAPDPIRDMGNLLQTVSAQRTKSARL